MRKDTKEMSKSQSTAFQKHQTEEEMRNKLFKKKKKKKKKKKDKGHILNQRRT